MNDVSEGTEEVDLSHSRIRTLRGFETHFQKLGFSLKRVNFRQNLITQLKFNLNPNQAVLSTDSAADLVKSDGCTSVAPLEHLSALEDLDLYDNRISKIEGLNGLSHLKSLDLSFNLLRRIENLDQLISLNTLYLIQNKVRFLK